jgi:hypothetical protein
MILYNKLTKLGFKITYKDKKFSTICAFNDKYEANSIAELYYNLKNNIIVKEVENTQIDPFNLEEYFNQQKL